MIAQLLLAGGGEILRIVDSADFDGTNDWMNRGADLTGAVDAKQGTFSAWIRVDGGDGVNRGIVSTPSLRFEVRHQATNVFRFLGVNAAGTGIMEFVSATAYVAGATWRHLLASWDLSAGTKYLYVNDVSDLGAVTTFTNDTIDYTTGNFTVGATTTAGALPANHCLAEGYLKMGVALDLSVTTNRRKFYSAGGKPVHLGTDGTLPGLGTPEWYSHLDDGEAVANFATNRGGGGNFTITGTLDTGTTSPSD